MTITKRKQVSRDAYLVTKRWVIMSDGKPIDLIEGLFVNSQNDALERWCTKNGHPYTVIQDAFDLGLTAVQIADG